MLFCILCSGCGSSKKKDSTISEQGHSMNHIYTENVSESFQVTTVEGEFVYDTTNKYETVGFYNCVFAGTVSNRRCNIPVRRKLPGRGWRGSCTIRANVYENANLSNRGN